MDKKNFSNVRIIISVVICFILMTVFCPRSAKWGYDYRQGHPWKYETLVSKFDFPIVKTEEQIREEMEAGAADVIPYFKYSDETVNKSLKALESIPLENSSIRPFISSEIRKIYSKGVVSDDLKGDMNELRNATVTVIYIQKGKSAQKCPADEVYKLSTAREKLYADVNALGICSNTDSLLSASGIYDLIVPNLIFDKQTTEMVHSASENYVSPTLGFVSAGQIIVSSGEIVTEDIAHMLDSYQKEYNASLGNSRGFLSVVGDALISLLILGLLLLVMYLVDKNLILDSRYREFVLFLLVLSAFATFILSTINEDLLFLVPYLMLGIYLQSFIVTKNALPIYLVILFPLLVHSQSGVLIYTISACGGTFSMFIFKRFNRGWRQFVSAIATFGVMAAVLVAFFLGNMVISDMLHKLLYLFLSALLSIAFYPFVFVLEKIFDLVSNTRFRDICELSYPLAITLERTAPGTFQHSLQVMNMAVACARAIGENIFLVRAGALYHDIGKMNNPMCFVENESLMALPQEEKYHSGLTPIQSAKDIIKHVSAGVEIAKKNNLPRPVVDMILSHHGTTCTSFFYDKFLKEGGDSSLRSEFCYDGNLPHTRAEVILMLCDSLEAASRTIPDTSSESISKLVEHIFELKDKENQFSEADVTMREMEIIKTELKTYLAQMHHNRVKYPKS